MLPLLVLSVGIAIVLGMIIALRINAFVALITAAIVVSLLAPGDVGAKVGRVADVSVPYNAVYLATAIDAGSLAGSWINDSGFSDRRQNEWSHRIGGSQNLDAFTAGAVCHQSRELRLFLRRSFHLSPGPCHQSFALIYRPSSLLNVS